MVGEEVGRFGGFLKECLAGRRLATDAEVKQAVTFEHHTSDTDFFYSRIQALMSQWDKRLNVNCDHVGVWCVPCVTQCHVYIKVRMKFSPSERLVLYFFGNRLVARCRTHLSHPCGSVDGCDAHLITSKVIAWLHYNIPAWRPALSPAFHSAL